MSTWFRDLKIGLRMLRKSPETTLVAVVALAIAIAATSTTFGVVDRVLLRPLSFPDADRLVTVWQVDPATPDNWRPLSYALAPDWLAPSSSFEAMAAVQGMSMTFTSSEEPETPFVRAVSHSYFDILGVRPLHGRNFFPEEDRASSPSRVVMLSQSIWQRRFAADPGIIGQQVELDEESWEVIGVVPDTFFNPAYGNQDSPEMWVPLGLPATADPQRRGGLFVAGKLAKGVSVEQARQELQQRSRVLAAAAPEGSRRTEALLVPLAERLVRDARPSVLVLFGAVLLVLLVACGNVANLLLHRSFGRQRELAVRRALGAGAGDLVRQLVAEALILTATCAVLGLVITAWAGEVVGSLAPTGFNIPRFDFSISYPLVGFTLALVLVAALIFGLLPALQALRPDSRVSLGAGAARAVGSPRSRRLRAGLVLGEVALSMVLLIAAGLMVRSFQKLHRIDPGYDPENVLVFRVATRGAEYADAAARVEFFHRVEDELEGLAGVEAVGAVQGLPFFSGFARTPVVIEGQPLPEAGREPRLPVYRATHDYLAAMEIPLLRGRLPNERDTAEAPRVAWINSRMVDDYFAGQDPLGGLIRVNGETEGRRIVGVLGNVEAEGSPPLVVPQIYLPLAQESRPTAMTFIVRFAGGDPMARLEEARSAVWRVDSRMSVYQADSLARLTDSQKWQPLLLSRLLGLFAFLALILAATGLYAVLSFAVSRRTREIGVRMALGARRGNVVGLVLRQGLGIVAAGIFAGWLGALGLARLLESQLYGVTATDLPTYAFLALFLTVVALLSCWIPARRATRIDPVVALGEE